MIQFLNNTVASHYKGKICLLRVDLNISFKDKSGLFRLDSVIPTIQLLLKHDIKVVIASHRGRPDKYIPSESLDVFAPLIAKRLGTDVDFISSYRIGALVKAVKASNTKVVLLENLRFFNGETANDPSFAKQLAALADFYVNDAFAVSHRTNASVVAITKFLPSFGGLLFEKEIGHLDEGLKKQKHPFVVIIGGAKISDKLGVIKNFWNKADIFLLGGGPANTVFKARGFPIGSSIVDEKVILEIKKYVSSPKIRVPSDVVFSGNKILDIGKKTIEKYSKIIASAKTIIWNGPMGVFEEKRFTNGTEAIWNAILKNKKAKIIIGGGDTMASSKLISNFSTKCGSAFSSRGGSTSGGGGKFRPPAASPWRDRGISNLRNVFISTGGGAMLEYLSGKKLPGIEALR